MIEVLDTGFMYLVSLDVSMAVGNQRGNRSGVTRKIVGDFSLTGTEEQVRLTISKRLDEDEFPVHLEQDVRVELVQEGDGPGYLEVHPKGD